MQQLYNKTLYLCNKVMERIIIISVRFKLNNNKKWMIP